jgi:hypothetical protein
MQREMKFEGLKAKIKTMLTGTADERAGAAAANRGWLDASAFEALAYMAVNANRYLTVVRPALVEFAEQFQPAADGQQQDYLALYAKRAGDRGFAIGDASSEMSLIALRAREDAIKVIDRWDVREVAKLVDLFPAAVPKQYHRAAITCYMADNEDADWMIAFDTSKHRPTSIH